MMIRRFAVVSLFALVLGFGSSSFVPRAFSCGSLPSSCRSTVPTPVVVIGVQEIVRVVWTLLG